MGFLWDDSTGARAVKFLRQQEQGFVIDSVAFASVLGVKPGALHQLLANALKLHYVRKVYGLGACVGWKLGPGGDSMTIERRRPLRDLSPQEMEQRRVANAERRARHAAKVVPERSAGATFAANLPAWLGGAADASRRGCSTRVDGRSRPSSYLARWHVVYRDARGLVHGDIQVQGVHTDLGVIDAWCRARGGVDRFAIDGFARIADADTGERIDVQEWLARPRRARTCKLAGSEV